MEADNHKKFLKNPDRFLEKIGSFFPEEMNLMKDGPSLDFTWVRKEACGTVIYIMSDSCRFCRFDAIKQFADKYNKFYHLIFLYGSEESKEQIREEYEISIPIELTDLKEIGEKLFIELVPTMIAMNRVGQIITCGSFRNEVESLEMRMEPFLNVYYSLESC
ncbi:hypothetical protein P4V86_05475 [Brevibacillus laterosporus]|uniref:hypothetical protein n=1 Tax=Brevibacillus laterosporus TaxID=1465 RepID=UPI00035C3FE4|nr:hypothetical protein [Brevibacillus laterosporus]ATO51459.1 hypothetical protein BrL25_21575 [Brevibacillus laterosporus DSM 25]MBG9801276.1 hypothetical protein [Brevibacillus laterosporus]MED2002808.1 hypothetical protein [Brevibacillus laterosporus]MED4765170.1 hypothetical protein [Brevibacillus laterosporus]TPH12445.1 hypothetical protein EGH09_17295 [Brevibacillus laterosporus]